MWLSLRAPAASHSCHHSRCSRAISFLGLFGGGFRFEQLHFLRGRANGVVALIERAANGDNGAGLEAFATGT